MGMELRGRLLDFKLDVYSNKHQLLLEVEDGQKVLSNFDLLKEKLLKITLAEFKNRRSNNANKLFHAMISRIAQKVNESDTRVKNELITSYGQIEYIDGDVATMTSNIPPEKMAEHESMHLKFMRVTFLDEKLIYVYRVYRGSHTYDTKEMSHLLECTMEYAKGLGCVTFSPQEIERAMKLWKA